MTADPQLWSAHDARPRLFDGTGFSLFALSATTELGRPRKPSANRWRCTRNAISRRRVQGGAWSGSRRRIEALYRLLAIPRSSIAVLGDMGLAMFRRAGLSIAMGNASLEVKRQADYVTASNADDGFALAIERFILNSRR